MKVALVHEFLTQLGGAERVLENFHEIFPDAPVFTLIYDEQKTDLRFKSYDLRISYLQKIYRKFKSYKWLLPLMPRAIESFDLSGYDLVLSDSSAFAKGLKTNAVHVCYCHTPTRYLWESMVEYVDSLPYPRLVKAAAKHYLKFNLKKWDYAAAQKPDFMIANSRTVRDRIKKYYNRDSEVIYPPVDTEFFKPAVRKQDYFFAASRLEPYKKIDLVIEAFNTLKLPLKIAGSGTFGHKLRAFAGPNVEFLGQVSDEKLRELYSGARAFVFPALEDAGIMVLESLACGTPVVGLAAGGTAEFVRERENGILFENQTAEDIVGAVKRLEAMKFDPEKVRATALPFDKEEFQKKIMAFIQTHAHRN